MFEDSHHLDKEQVKVKSWIRYWIYNKMMWIRVPGVKRPASRDFHLKKKFFSWISFPTFPHNDSNVGTNAFVKRKYLLYSVSLIVDPDPRRAKLMRGYGILGTGS